MPYQEVPWYSTTVPWYVTIVRGMVWNTIDENTMVLFTMVFYHSIMLLSCMVLYLYHTKYHGILPWYHGMSLWYFTTVPGMV